MLYHYSPLNPQMRELPHDKHILVITCWHFIREGRSFMGLSEHGTIPWRTNPHGLPSYTTPNADPSGHGQAGVHTQPDTNYCHTPTSLGTFLPPAWDKMMIEAAVLTGVTSNLEDRGPERCLHVGTVKVVKPLKPPCCDLYGDFIATYKMSINSFILIATYLLL